MQANPLQDLLPLSFPIQSLRTKGLQIF